MAEGSRGRPETGSLRAASRTAVLVCQGRAVADGVIAPGRFHDPIAFVFLNQSEQEAVIRARGGPPPQQADRRASMRERFEYEMLRAAAESMVPRSLAIDEAVLAHAAPQLVVLGAGLDGRAWRLQELSKTRVFEVDHPTSQADKQSRCRGVIPCAGTLSFVPVDFASDHLEDALAAAGQRLDEPSTWIWEGVVPYLTLSEVRKTLAAIAARSAAGSWIVVAYQAPSWITPISRLAARAMTAIAGLVNPFEHEPARSAFTPRDMRRELAAHGFSVSADESLLEIAARYEVALSRRRSLGIGRVVVARRQRDKS